MHSAQATPRNLGCPCRDRTIFNQGPAGSGKYGLVDDAFMAVRVGGTARVLRTHTPQSLGGVATPTAALTFSGSYPLTRLALEDATLVPPTAELDLFGYSTFRPTEPEASAVPHAAPPRPHPSTG